MCFRGNGKRSAVTQRSTVEFAVWSPRKGVKPLNVHWHHVRQQPFPEIHLQIRQLDDPICAWHDIGMEDTVVVKGEAINHGAFCDSRVAPQNLFYLAEFDPHAIDFHLMIAPTSYVETPIGRHVPHFASAIEPHCQATTGGLGRNEALGGHIRKIEVRQRDRRTGNAELPMHAEGHKSQRVIENESRDVGNWPITTSLGTNMQRWPQSSVQDSVHLGRSEIVDHGCGRKGTAKFSVQIISQRLTTDNDYP